MHDSTTRVDLRYTLGLSEQFERDRSMSRIHDIVDVYALVWAYRSTYIMHVHHVRMHALVSLAASAAWPDKKLEPNDKRQTGLFYRYR